VSGRVELRGQSGAVYSFLPLDTAAGLRPIGVTWVVADAEAGGWRVLCAGHTNNLADRSWTAALATARESAPAAQLMVRLNVSRSIREAEAADLQPAMG
jgi:uncharacterized protein (DUF2235 family)